MSGFRRYLPNMVFAMLPVFALIFYVLYFRSRRFYAEHLIFAFHFHAFVFVVLTVMAFFPKVLQDVSLLVVAAYLFVAMRQVFLLIFSHLSGCPLAAVASKSWTWR